ncbi:MAG: flagellar export chaperone FliS [Planctomycetota bacterium]|jgi:flagellar protein FliS
MDAADKYKTEAISTQQRGKLIVILYEGAIKFLNIAKQKLQEGDYALKGIYIGKAQDIITELNNCLDMSAAPDIAGDLRSLYNFLYRHLNEANIERSAEKLDDCIEVLGGLCSAWEEVAASPEVAAMDEMGAGGLQA